MIRFVVEGGVARRAPVVFEQHVVAHGVHERPKALGLADFVFPQGGQHACECFLPDILDRVRGIQTGTKLEPDEFAEIGNKMLLRPEVSRPQAFDVGLVK
jgi:hypothetical protein